MLAYESLDPTRFRWWRMLASSDAPKRKLAVAILSPDALPVATELLQSGSCEDRRLGLQNLEGHGPCRDTNTDRRIVEPNRRDLLDLDKTSLAADLLHFSTQVNTRLLRWKRECQNFLAVILIEKPVGAVYDRALFLESTKYARLQQAQRRGSCPNHHGARSKAAASAYSSASVLESRH